MRRRFNDTVGLHMNELQHSLESMGVVQYLFAVAFLICYALTLGGFLGPGARVNLAGGGLLSAVGFALSADFWVHGVLLLSFTVVGMGFFLGLAWVLKALFASAVGEVSTQAAYDDALSATADDAADDLEDDVPAGAARVLAEPLAEPSMARFVTADQQAS